MQLQGEMHLIVTLTHKHQDEFLLQSEYTKDKQRHPNHSNSLTAIRLTSWFL
jgi:hypothetical protein